MKKLLYICFAIALTSCQPYTDFSFIVQNDSSETVIITGENILNNTDSNTIIAPTGSATVGLWSQRGKQLGNINPEEILGNDIIMVNALGDSTTKSYESSEDWDLQVDDNGRYTSQTYTLFLTDDDF